MSWRRWSARNRWALILLVPTFALALAASSSRLVHFWWDWQPHEPTHAALGSLTSFAVPGEGSTMTDVAIGVLDVTEVGQAMDDDRVAYEAPTPPRATWWRITLQVEGELPQDAACTLALASGWAAAFPQSAYLLREEALAWQKTPWFLHVVAD